MENIGSRFQIRNGVGPDSPIPVLAQEKHDYRTYRPEPVHSRPP